ncbi:MAG TPA: pitrilysin family protein [Thermoanaerobaculia bacterium]|nr:pitrilysin family protein [Thermoanaerobaculia bacterium]
MKSLAVLLVSTSLLAAPPPAAKTPAPAPGERTEPPPPAPPRPLKLPKPAERTLANGLRVLVAERHEVPIAAARLVVMSGGEVDPKELAGLAQLTAALLAKGTETKSAPELAEAVESLGTSLSTNAEWDASAASLSVLATKLAPALSLLADAVRRPAFHQEEIERLRKQRIDELSVSLGQPGVVAGLVADRLVFGESPYGHPIGGTPGSIARIKRDDVVALHRAWYRPDNAVLVLAGDVTPDGAFALAEKLFGDWAKPDGKPPAHAASAAAVLAPRAVVVDKPESGQAAVVLATRGIRRSDPDYYKGIVSNAVLTGYSGRLNQEIRVKRGLSYGAGSSLDSRRDTGPFTASAQTKNESGGEVARLLGEELAKLEAGPPSADELTGRKMTLIGGFSRRFETAEGLASTLASAALYGISFEELQRWIPTVEAVKPEDVKAFAKSHLPRSGASLVVVGDAKKFLEALKKEIPTVEVIPFAELDIGSATLRKTPPPPTRSPKPTGS